MNLVKDIIFHTIIYASIMLAWIGFILILNGKEPMLLLVVILASLIGSILYNVFKN